MNERGKVALYRKYRPQKLDDLVGQPQVTDILSLSLKKGIISHAYLFSGPRGTGKTSAARILAHEFNGIPYSENLNLDIVEIDAASNRRIEDIRDLREVIKLAPTKLKYKVYIIDEVHMLTNESFNALLKTLEEPPEHAIFILATTDLHKVPPTILSRTQKFTFKLLPNKELTDHLNNIAKKEGIDITDGALSLVADLGGGSVRDALSILDQLKSMSEKITEDSLRDIVGMPSADLQKQIDQALKNYDSASLLNLTSQMIASGANQKEVIKNLINSLVGVENPTNLHLNLIDDLTRALSSYDPTLFLKIALLKFNPNIEQIKLSAPKIIQPKLKAAPEHPAEEIKQEAPKINNEDEKLSLANDKSEEVKSDQPEERSSDKESKTSDPKLKFSSVTWQKVLEEVKNASAGTYAMLRLSSAQADGDILNITFKFDFHKKKMVEGKNTKALTDALSSVLGIEPEFKFFVDKDVKIKSLSLNDEPEAVLNDQGVNPAQSSILGKVSDIMGGGEVLDGEQ